jgi:AraC-like DNA-binding protein
MNYIIKDENNIGALSNTVKADSHKHWMLQLFMSSEDNLDVIVMGRKLSCRCIVVDINTKHNFRTGHKVHFTLLIEPTSILAIQIRRSFLKNKNYYILPDNIAILLQEELRKLMHQINAETFNIFLNTIYSSFYNQDGNFEFDERVKQLFDIMYASECHPEDHNLGYYACKLALSKSRLAHLFKEQTGIPLKSYLVLHKLKCAYDVIFDGGSITVAAMAAGFDSSAHLAYTNRKMTGMSASVILKNSEFLKVSI